MFKIYDGRDYFYQWDLDRKLIVENPDIEEVHFCNRTDECSLVCEVFEEDGKQLVNVPNILLQTDWRIRAYAYDGNSTKYEKIFTVKTRTKPADYVYTETEIKRYDDLEKRIKALEAGGGSSGGYYTPIVEDGVLSWTPSNESMPIPTSASIIGPQGIQGEQGPQGPQGIQGETGSSGVYVGSGEMPADCNVQIDSDGNAEEYATKAYVDELFANIKQAEEESY